MKQTRQFVEFLVYSNLFIAACVVLMVIQTEQLLLQGKTDDHFTGFVFFSTLCSYSFHWYLTSQSLIPSRRMVWLHRNRWVHVVLFFTGLAGAVFYFFYWLLPWWPWLLVASVATFLYSAPKIPHPLFRSLRKVAIGKTIFLSFIWMYVTTVLPVIIAGGERNESFFLFSLSRFFLIYSICIIFDYRDRADDKVAGVRSLITYLGEKNITRLFIFSVLVFGVSTFALGGQGYSGSQVFVLALPGILTGLLYNYARKNFSDLFYYVVLDGLMALSALLMLIPGI